MKTSLRQHILVVRKQLHKDKKWVLTKLGFAGHAGYYAAALAEGHGVYAAMAGGLLVLLVAETFIGHGD